MKVNDLSKELGITNKDLITFLKEKGFKVSSHMQIVTDEMIEIAKANFVISTETEKNEVTNNNIKNDKTEKVSDIRISSKTFKPDDEIPCRSVTPWELVTVGADKQTVYSWEYYGDVEYLKYKDLQALRKTDLITKPKIIIEDADLCYQWRRDLGDTYKYFLGTEYPEEFFDLPDSKFEELLTKAPNVVKEVIKTTALSMIKHENYPTIQKLTFIDNILGTCLKEFL